MLSGGASAVYGSDALTGVVNFVLKQDFEGLEFSVQAGTDQYMDNSKNRLSLVGGRNFADGRGNITFAMQVDQDNGLLMGDRVFSRTRISMTMETILRCAFKKATSALAEPLLYLSTTTSLTQGCFLGA